jgi:hypothetical protein
LEHANLEFGLKRVATIVETYQDLAIERKTNYSCLVLKDFQQKRVSMIIEAYQYLAIQREKQTKASQTDNLMSIIILLIYDVDVHTTTKTQIIHYIL